MREHKNNSAEFLISLKKIKAEIKFLQRLGFKVLFPVKTLPELNFLKCVAGSVDGFDVSNASEFKKISAFKKLRIGITSPQTSDLAEVNKLSKGKALVAVHNRSQLSRVKEFGSFAIRLNPYSFANVPTASSVRFGMDKSEFTSLSHIHFEDPHFRGVTAHFGSAVIDKRLPFQFLKSLHQLLKQKNISPKVLNLGGGWSRLSTADMKFVAKSARQFFPKSEIWIEPGERITRDAISIKAKIIDVTEREHDIFLLLNCSVEAHLRWTRPEVKATFLTSEVPAEVSLKNLFAAERSQGPRIWFVGLTCSEGDRIGPFYLKSKINYKRLEGKEILLKNISGYALAWNHEFNGIPKLSFRAGAK